MGSTLPKHYTQTLKNGLEVVVIPMDNDSGVITTDVYYRVGSRNEILGKSGIAHMLEHMNFKSSEKLQAGQFDEIVKSYGGITNASTGFDYTHYFIKSSSGNLDQSLELFSELMQNLKLKEEEFLPERDVVAEERRWRTDNNPIGFLYFRLFNHTYIYHPYHWTPIGFMQDIQHWTIDDIREFHKIYYQPKNAKIVVAGDIAPETVFEAAKVHFESIPNRADVPKVHMKEPRQNGAKKITIHKESEVEKIAIAWHVPNYEHEDQVALSAISELLSSGKSSRLQRNLVDKKRLANQIYAYNMELIDPGVFIILAICNQGIKAEDVEKEIRKQVESIKEGKIKEAEINKIKINTKADFIFSLENSSNVADIFGSFFTRGNVAPLLNYEENLDKLTVIDLVEVANKYLNKENSTTLILRK